MPKGYRQNGVPFFEVGNVPWNKSFKWGNKKEYQKVYLRQYSKTLKGFYFSLKGRAVSRNQIFTVTYTEFEEWFNSQSSYCSYCDKFFESIRELTIDRMENDKGYVLGNLALSCDRCNRIKSNIFSSKEMKEIGTKYNLKDR